MDRLSQMLMMGAAPSSPYFSMPFGTFTDGGYFAGIISQGGDRYAIIVSPRPAGQSSLVQWKSSASFGPTASITLNDGPAASASMNSSYEAAHFCNNLTINGFTDWYLPARDELELCYRNLKPTTTANDTAIRAKSAFVYPEGDDVTGDALGINRNSFPIGAAYTTSVPAQTPVAIFQSGGAQAFATDYAHWSSSDLAETDAWRQSFTSGVQNQRLKTASLMRARAIRRVAI